MSRWWSNVSELPIAFVGIDRRNSEEPLPPWDSNGPGGRIYRMAVPVLEQLGIDHSTKWWTKSIARVSMLDRREVERPESIRQSGPRTLARLEGVGATRRGGTVFVMGKMPALSIAAAAGFTSKLNLMTEVPGALRYAAFVWLPAPSGGVGAQWRSAESEIRGLFASALHRARGEVLDSV